MSSPWFASLRPGDKVRLLREGVVFQGEVTSRNRKGGVMVLLEGYYTAIFQSAGDKSDDMRGRTVTLVEPEGS